MVRKKIGVALQDAAIDPLMTGNELLRLQAVLHGISGMKVNKDVQNYLNVGLTAAGDKRVGTTRVVCAEDSTSSITCSSTQSVFLG